MFESLQSRLGGVFDKLRGRGALTEADVDDALKEVRTALIEADVELAYQYGLTGVPALIFNNRYLVSGAQPFEVLQQVVEKVAAENAGATR